MDFFKKKRSEQYDILKLYKVVSLEEANSFKTKDCIDFCIGFFEKYLKMPDFFDLNYGFKTWKSYNKYKEYIKKNENQEIVNLSAFDLNTESTFTISNNLLNSNKDFSYIEISIAINTPFLGLISKSDFIVKLCEDYKIDYGYGLTLDSNFDFVTEKKIKKSIFGSSLSTSISKEDVIWHNKAIELNKGLIKKIYPYNILNQSQLSSNEVNQYLNNGIGKIIAINENMSIWHLNENEYAKIGSSSN